MRSMQGIWHTTSLQQAQQRAAPGDAASSSTDSRRNWPHNATRSDVGSRHSPGTSIAHNGVEFQRAVSIAPTSHRLVASPIARLMPAPTTSDSEYSQRKALAATPSSSWDPELDVAHATYNLAPQLVANFATLGIKQLYPWQKNCLKGPGLLEGDRNLVYSAPTGGGADKTVVLMLKRVTETPGTKVLVVLPYVALVQEKVGWLRSVVSQVSRPAYEPDDDVDKSGPWRRRADHDSLRVVGFFGGSKMRATWHDFDIGVCTLEKANALINTAIDDCSIAHLGAVVLDELHMIDDGHRGYLLELIGTKMLSLEQPVQIIGMSATLPNMNLMADWLNAHCYETLYRPVPIEEHIVYDGNIFAVPCMEPWTQNPRQMSCQSTPVRQVQRSVHKEFVDPVLNAVVALAYETAVSGYGALVFAGSRGLCESDARLISRVMPGPHEISASLRDKRLDLLADLRSLSSGVDAVLEETVMYGVAYHRAYSPASAHRRRLVNVTANSECTDAGLTSEERELVAAAYDAGTLLVCVATCSLAAGINLPARRVILHNARMGRDMIGPAMLRQMRGRAGRAGRCPVGETYLCCRASDLDQVLELMQADMPAVCSCLSTEDRRLQRALLEVISTRLASNREALDDYLGRSLLQHSHGPEFVKQCTDASLDEVQSMGLAACDSLGHWTPTQLGRAIVASCIHLDDGVFVHSELAKALRAFAMDGEMHTLYLLTPVQDFGVTVNWQVFRNAMESLDESGLRVLGLVGIKPTAILRLAQGGSLKETTVQEREQARVYRRFYLALQLRDLCNEMPIHVVARKYDMPRGAVQSLSQTCHGFAAAMVKFCEQMGWGVMAAALHHFTDRLMAGARADLLALAKIPFVKSRTARVFWESGYRSIASVANAHAQQLLPVLMQAQPNKIRARGRDDDKLQEKLLAKAQVITAAANRIWHAQMQGELEED